MQNSIRPVRCPYIIMSLLILILNMSFYNLFLNSVFFQTCCIFRSLFLECCNSKATNKMNIISIGYIWQEKLWTSTNKSGATSSEPTKKAEKKLCATKSLPTFPQTMSRQKSTERTASTNISQCTSRSSTSVANSAITSSSSSSSTSYTLLSNRLRLHFI